MVSTLNSQMKLAQPFSFKIEMVWIILNEIKIQPNQSLNLGMWEVVCEHVCIIDDAVANSNTWEENKKWCRHTKQWGWKQECWCRF